VPEKMLRFSLLLGDLPANQNDGRRSEINNQENVSPKEEKIWKKN
jgi:hypothetical protein